MTLDTAVAPDAGMLEGDADRLEQALQNLAANALRHVPDGGRLSFVASTHADGRLRVFVGEK